MRSKEREVLSAAVAVRSFSALFSAVDVVLIARKSKLLPPLFLLILLLGLKDTKEEGKKDII
ncbi:hypothetical protein EYF80_052393 [Liparis tanakae]|uniref:Uncharacterized protein n=1 Tax=Liparis tanakae TaxID=230148 RepID=A0A4Z2F8H3_9TELE|nr:hypothetical protein EYF80_052393 [Liparis tanakae]